MRQQRLPSWSSPSVSGQSESDSAVLRRRFVEASRTGGILILTHRRNLVDQFLGELTDRGRDALMKGDWDELGRVMNAVADHLISGHPEMELR